jgi:hypothetical protein
VVVEVIEGRDAVDPRGLGLVGHGRAEGALWAGEALHPAPAARAIAAVARFAWAGVGLPYRAAVVSGEGHAGVGLRRPSAVGAIDAAGDFRRRGAGATAEGEEREEDERRSVALARRDEFNVLHAEAKDARRDAYGSMTPA